MNLLRTQARVRAWDRRKAAIHEAGHFVIAAHFGIPEVEAWLTDLGGDGHDMTWGGHCRFPSAAWERHSRHRYRMFAMAGAVAERVWDERREPGWIDWWEAFFDVASMSATDWAGAGCAPGEPDWRAVKAAEAVGALFAVEGGPLWHPLASLARKLMTHGQIRTEWGDVVPQHVPSARRARLSQQ